MALTDGRFSHQLHRAAELVDIVDDDWRQDALGHDDFDLPSSDLDSDNDEVRTAPKRTNEEKWSELCLDDFQLARPTNTRNLS
eukprot:CAMPEP_0183355528 /NCGR_PEP_ID=MMETSP0164_2-20130417/40761_1 /TAXON_ID=221442 /ORGANISM="Coccolithus pelagicus ssp braarudi, Strain PLY182g" /LENGTH=82 /DNA_ID=CAMNT_0025528663 /DNA_START=31 /DNA_END=279 /DNA_ORIENTATION=-